MKTTSHFETLSKYIFAQKIKTRKGGEIYQLYKIQDSKIIKIGGLNSEGFMLHFINDKKSNSCATIIDLYQAIRGANENLIAFKQTTI
jgi:hypothetical protein